jgi:CBS domain-containing protein
MSSINVDMKEQMTEEFLPQQKTKEGDWDVEDSDESEFPR